MLHNTENNTRINGIRTICSTCSQNQLQDYSMDALIQFHFTYNRILTSKQSNSLKKKHKIRAITPFKVIEVCINRKPICDFLLVINSN